MKMRSAPQALLLRPFDQTSHSYLLIQNILYDTEMECWDAVSGTSWITACYTEVLDLPGTLLLCY